MALGRPEGSRQGRYCSGTLCVLHSGADGAQQPVASAHQVQAASEEVEKSGKTGSEGTIVHLNSLPSIVSISTCGASKLCKVVVLLMQKEVILPDIQNSS